MQTIQDILDSTLTLGFSYFHGLGDDFGYLRRMLHTNPSLEALYAQLKDDIQFIDETDGDYFRNKTQLDAFKSLKKYLKLAKEYVKTQLDKKKKGSTSKEAEIKSEIRQLDKDLRDGLIEPEEHDYAVKMLLKPSTDDLSEVKSRFEQIDSKVKQELKHVGFEEEEEKEEDEDYILPEDDHRAFFFDDEEEFHKEFEEPMESVESNEELLEESYYNPSTNEAKKSARKILYKVTGKSDWDLSARTVSFSDLARGDEIFVTVYNFDPMKYGKYVDELRDLSISEGGFLFAFRTTAKEKYVPDINKLVDEKHRRYSMNEFNDIYEAMNPQTAVNPQQQAMMDKKRALALKKEVDPALIDRRGKLPPEKQAMEVKNIATRLINAGWSQAEVADFMKANAFTKRA